MEWYHDCNVEYINHKEEHDLGALELSECLACEVCHPIEREVPAVFKKFWDALFKFEDTILTYNDVTLRGLLNLLKLMEYRYILEDWDVENKFQKFWEWYNTILEYDMRVVSIGYRKLSFKEPGEECKQMWDRYLPKDNIKWMVKLLKEKIEEMGGKFSNKNIQKIWDLQIRIELILTDEFLGTVWEVINLSNERLKYEVNKGDSNM
ncbi:unnamed protein product [Rhizophagus irregularis]|nr:unnamed protein product [Rhizophagus irregularis]